MNTTGLDIRLTLEAIDRTAQVLNSVVGRIDRLTGANNQSAQSAKGAEAGFVRQAGAMALAGNQALDLLQKFGQLTGRLREFVGAGVSFNATLEDARTSLSALLLNFRPEEFGNFDKAMAKSAQTVEQLVEAAKKSPATFGQLLQTMQGISGAAFSANIGMERQVKLTVLLSQALKALVPPEQLLQESRALLTGNIDQNAQAARALGITTADISRAREQGQLYEFLEKKLSAFAIAGERATKNFSTSLSNLGDAFEVFRAKATAPIFDALRAGFGRLTETVSSPELLYSLSTLGQDLGMAAASGVELASSLISVTPQILGVAKALAAVAAVGAVGRVSFLLLSGDLWAGIVRGAGGAVAALRSMPAAIGRVTDAFGLLRGAPLTLSNVRAATALAGQEARAASAGFAMLGATIAALGAAAGLIALNEQMDKLSTQQKGLAVLSQQGTKAVDVLTRSGTAESESDRADRLAGIADDIAQLRKLREGMTAELSSWEALKSMFGFTPGEATEGDAAAIAAADVALRRFEEARKRLTNAPIVAAASKGGKAMTPEKRAEAELAALEIERAANEAANDYAQTLYQARLQGFAEFAEARRDIIARDFDLDLAAAELKGEAVANAEERAAQIATDKAVADAKRQKALVALELAGVKDQMEANLEATKRASEVEAAEMSARMEVAKATGDERTQIELEVAQVIDRLRKDGLSEERLAAVQTILTNERVAESIRRKSEAQREFVLAQTRAAISAVQGDRFASNVDRERALLSLRRSYVEQLERSRSVELAALEAAATSDERKIEARQRMLELETEIARVKGEDRAAGRPTSFTRTRDFASSGLGYDEAGGRSLVEPYAELDKFIAGTLQTTFNGISSSIAGWVNGTATWGQVWLGVKNSIVEGFVEMALEYTVFHWLRMAMDRLFYGAKQVQDTATHTVLRANIAGTAAAGVTATATTAAAQTAAAGTVAAASAPAAAATSIWSFGSAAGIGLALALAAIIGITAALAFNKGGVVPGGKTGKDTVPAMLTPGEVVIPEPTVRRYGEGYFLSRYVNGASGSPPVVNGRQRLNTGGVVGQGSADGRAVNIFLVDSRDEAGRLQRNSDGEAFVLDVMKRNSFTLK